MAQLPGIFHLFGIRHHGPGCARMLLAELETLQPDCLLIEGPPDADGMLAFANDPTMKPPVALLVYAEDHPQKAAFYPMAEFSPEWQAIQYGSRRSIPIRFMDLPQRHQLGMRIADEEAANAESGPSETAGEAEGAAESAEDEGTAAESDLTGFTAEEEATLHADPLTWLAQAAGMEDGEEWWERMVEQRQDGAGIFPAIQEAMTNLRDSLPESNRPAEALREKRREAWMRETMRSAQKEGFQRIAVVCGAWHVPALAAWPPASQDKEILAKLPKTPVASTWVPWTYGRLAYSSGYGAGVPSPGYYDFLWHTARTEEKHPTIGWVIKIAGLLREEDLDCSSAHVIETVRLANSLAAMRERTIPGLRELNEAVSSVICMGDDGPLRLIERKLIIGERLGEIPESMPAVPLAQDVAAEQKRLRFKPEAVQKTLDLDLRKPNDLERSHLLHRLNLLAVPWGNRHDRNVGKGTFHELWDLQWQPEFAVRLVEMALWGNTVVDAATAKVLDDATKSQSVAAVARLAETVLIANLPGAVGGVVHCLEELASTTGAVGQLMEAVPPLVKIARYGNVRQTDTSQLIPVLDGMITRISINLSGACSSLDDEAAATMQGQINAMHQAIKLLEDEEHLRTWQQALLVLADRDQLHGLLAGTAARRLFDDEVESGDKTLLRLTYALSGGNEPAAAADWVRGFLQGSGMVLLHDDRLFAAIDTWLTSLGDEAFLRILPLVRRTFSDFASGERRQIGERVKQPVSRQETATVAATSGAWDEQRVAPLLPVLRRILGMPEKPTHSPSHSNS